MVHHTKLSERTRLRCSQSISSYNVNSPLISSINDTLPELEETEQYEVPETKTAFLKRIISPTTVYCVLFFTVIQSSIYWTSLWPYLLTIDPSADESFLGWILMGYNLSGGLASPLFGYWTNRLQGVKIPIMFGLAMNIVGNFLLAFVESFSLSSRKWIMLISRFISGCGSGIRGALFAYSAMSSKDQNMAISIMGAMISGAIMLGPGVQAATVPIGYPGFVEGEFRLNMYTTPAYLTIVFGIFLFLIMSFVFSENWISISEQQNDDGEHIESTVDPYDVSVLLICGLARFTLDYCSTIIDTIGSPLTMIMFQWTKSQAIVYNGSVNIVIGILDMFGQIIIGKYVLRWVSERKLIGFSLSMMFCFFIAVFPWPGLPPLLDSTVDSSSSTANFNDALNTTFLANSTIVLNTIGEPDMACHYSWCSSTTQMSLAQYLIAFGFLFISISTGYTPAATLFSKALGPHRQGTWQGFFSACDYMGMTLSPPISSNLFQFVGPRTMWGFACALNVAAIVPFIAYFKRLVPWKDAERNDGVNMTMSTREQ